MQMTSQLQLSSLLAKLQAFAAKEDTSRELAGQLEVELDELFEDDSRFEDLVLALASYQPGGGEFLYDEHVVAQLCARAMPLVAEALASKQSAAD